ncbi:MAG: gliding motility-associated C-terminal domain-containing protein [Bacteroidetes bacterium]|nr:gliding motility-associated C-terminal domain-containing protein [Bacteroidota bacterium]
MSNLAIGQYITHGDAIELATSPCKCITLTPEENYKMGAFWNETPLDLSQSFELIVEADFGCNIASSDGGDGIAFLLQSSGPSQAPTGYGGNLGYNGISPSLAVQFDTYRDNPIDYPENNDPGGGFFPYYDHVGLMKNGSCNHETSDDLSTQAFTPSFTDVEDCSTYSSHQITFVWDATTFDFEVMYCNDVEGCFTVVNQNIDITNTIFSGNPLVYWGFTGSTGGANNEQSVCIQYFDRDSITADTTVCYNDNLIFDLSCLNNFSFEWSDQNGTIINSSSVFDIVATQSETFYLQLTNNYTGSTFNESFTVTVLQPTLEENLSQHIDNECFGGTTGQLGLNFINATGLVNYSINNSPSQSDSIFSNLSANTYQAMAIDQYGCADSVEIIINQEDEIILNIDNIVGVVCNTVNTGAIDVTPSGGVGNFTIFWQDVNGTIYNSEDLASISDGYYDYTLIDGNNCEINGQVFVDQINAIDMDTSSLINIDCYSFNTGEIGVIPTGGLAPFDYSWVGPNGFNSNASTISNLAAGSYTLTLTDDENCYKVYPFELFEGNEILFSLDSIADASCVYSADGTAIVAHSGGTGNTSTVILDVLNNQVSNLDLTTNLLVGNYIAYAEDDLGCQSASIPFSIGSPTDMTITTLDIDDAECYGGDEGKIQIIVNGGTLPYSAFNWIGPNGYNNNSINIYSLYAGNYTVSATDNNGCIKQQTFTIGQPSDINITTANLEYIKCKGDNSGSISLNVNGGTPPYDNFSWIGPNGYTSNNLNISNLYEGLYALSLEDDNGCLKESSFNMIEPDVLLQFELTTSPSCVIENIGQANINITGGVPPYTIDWYGLNPNALPYGEHLVQVSDLANCVIQDSFVVNLLPQPTANFLVDSVLKINTPVSLSNTSENSISWNWNFGNQTFSTDQTPSPIFNEENTYQIFLQSYNNYGCSDTLSKNVKVVDELILHIPNSFTPNGDLRNDSYNISIHNEMEFELKIYNLYGTLLFSTTDKNKSWDGTYKGNDVQMGSYVVSIYAKDVFERVYQKNKTIILLR